MHLLCVYGPRLLQELLDGKNPCDFAKNVFFDSVQGVFFGNGMICIETMQAVVCCSDMQ